MNTSVIVPSSALKVNRARSPERALTPLRGIFRREAGDKAVAQVASAVDVDVAHRVVVGPRKDREEVEVLRGSLHRVVRVQLHLHSRRLSSCLAAPMGATSCHGLASRWIFEPTSLSQKVTNAPMSFVKARATVTLCSATPGGTVDCCVCTVG